MMRSTFIILLLLAVCCAAPFRNLAQTGLVLQVDSAQINLTCGDLFGSPEPMWGVDINGEGYQYYPQDGPCFQVLPNPQYFATAGCPAELPAEVEVCFHGFENDPTFPPPLSCAINPDCEATICRNFAIPASGDTVSLTLDLPAAGDVTGTLFFTMAVESVTPPATNDRICDAIDLGTLDFDSSLGSLTGPVYNNYCADNVDEPNPFDVTAEGVFLNDQGVWFTFETGPEPSGILLIDVKSDPLQTSDEFDAQAAVYEFPGGNCTGIPILRATNSDNSSFDVGLRLTCAKPNTTYHLLVDGGAFGNESIEGPFSLRIVDPGIKEGGDLRCDFEDLGVVPENGIVETEGFRSNLCASDLGDPFVSAFISQHSVWFSFVAPASGHVLIEAVSDQLIQPLDAQLAIYSPFTGACNGGFRHLQSQYLGGDPDESMEVSCLFGGRRYFVLVDGSGFQARGIFKLSVSDAGDITPLTVVDTLICPGESVAVGSKIYTIPGNYIDTLTVKEGCDSIVHTNLTVAEPLSVTFEQTRFAFGQGAADAEARLIVSGGIGTPLISWCDGQSGPVATGLVGGSECCVSVVDSAGCLLEACFDIEFITGAAPVYRDTSVACHGDQDGLITFSAANGLPPYDYRWQSPDGQYAGNGTIDADFQEVRIPNLPGGSYAFTISDSFGDTTFSIRVREPEQLRVQLTRKSDITCAGTCDGQISASVSGGTLPYTLEWSDGPTGTAELENLCPGEHTLTVTDANGCQTTFSTTLETPPPFTATAELLREVACYQGSDGQIGVRIENGTAASYRWSNGATTPSQSSLPAGFYQLTVTSDLFCESVTEIELTQPEAPLELAIEAVRGISCGSETDGVLRGNVEGPFQNLNYRWSNGSTTAETDNLAAGSYSLQVRNERGCITTDTFLLEEPVPIEARLSTRDITCLDPPESGIVYIDEVSGGLGDYRYSIDGDRFVSKPLINNLSGGEYSLIVQDRGGCEQQFPFRIQTPPELSVSLGQERIELDLGDSLQLTAVTNSNDVRFQWEHDRNLTGSSTVVAPQKSAYYRIEAVDTETFCRAEATVFVQVNKKRRVYIPNAFSPNMDGNNDYFFIYGDNDIVAIASLRIFTREGRLVFEDRDLAPNDPVRSWDGTFRGQRLNSGVYVYVAEIKFVDGLTEVFKGDVALVR